jgi:hypothetical protein
VRPLSEIEVDFLWRQKEDMDPDEAGILVERMSNNQPNVLSYLLATGSDILDQPEREVIFYMGVLLWYVIDTLGFVIPEISLESLIETEEKNFTMLEYLAGEPESEFLETVGKIMDSYNQSELLRYIIDKIMEEPQGDVEISENHIGVMVIYLKTFIDCIDLVL